MCKSGMENLLKIFRSSISAVLPENLIRKSLTYSSAEILSVCGHDYNLKNRHLYVVGFGKAVKNMAIEVENIFGSKIKQGIVSVPFGSSNYNDSQTNIVFIEGAKNNLPDQAAENTSKKVKSLISSLSQNDFLLLLISGGGSALLPLPKDPITLDEKMSIIKMLANAGADIKELNTVRKRISDFKGGQLAIQSQPAQVVSLILSDIVGDPIDLIASGPTVENKDNSNKALEIINKYKLLNKIPKSVRLVLESLEPTALFPCNNIENYIIGSNKMSVDAAVKEIHSIGYTPFALSHTVTGNVKHVAKEYMKLTLLFYDLLNKKINETCLKTELGHLNIPIMNELDYYSGDDKKGICLVLSGETTVEVKGKGIGGRNQQLALEFSILLNENKNKLNNYNVHFLSAGTDGIDGPTDAAGAIGYLNLISDAEKENMNVTSYIDNNDSYTFYKKFKNGSLHLLTGHTNTNVMDIHLLLIQRII